MRAEQRGRLVVPLVLSAALAGVYWFFRTHPLIVGRHLGDIREDVFGKNERWLAFVVIVPLILLVVRLLDATIFDVLMSRRRNVVAPQLLRQILSIVLYLLLFASASSWAFDIDVAKFLFTGTVVAAVIGLALQETLGNLFSGIALHMEESFEVGDVVHSGEYLGVVEGVTWRATRIRGFNNQVVVLPNSLISRERLEIFPRKNLNARTLQVGIDYHTPPARVIEVLTQAATHVEGVAREMPPIARVASFGDSAVIYDIKYYTRDYSARDRIDAEIRRAVWYALRRNDISIPFPVRSFAPYTPTAGEEEITSEQIVRQLHGIDLLSPLSEEELAAIGAATRVHRYAKGEGILRRGAAGESMFAVLNGTVSIRVADANETGGHELAQLGPGSVFGEMALLTGEARTADVVAITDVVALEIRKASLEPVLHAHPELAAALSSKVTERRDDIAAYRSVSAEEHEESVLSRIRAYFGL